jgi:hypothetical protein
MLIEDPNIGIGLDDFLLEAVDRLAEQAIERDVPTPRS